LEIQLRARGATRAPIEEADAVVVNSCSVTATADHGARQTLRRVARLNPEAQVVATGCYATRAGDEIAVLPGGPDIVPNDEKHTIVDRLIPAAPTTAERFADGPGACGGTVSPGVVGRVAFMLRVQTGCDEPCAYCIIPSTRGRGRSLAASHVMAAVDHAAANGFREVVLTGVHLGSYGRDLEPRSSLVQLLETLDGHSADVRFRISSLEPMDCPTELIDLVAGSGRFAPHFHLSLQHASDAVLRRMRRPYRFDDYRRVVDHVRDRMPHAGIGSDLIAGFPGEREEDARKTHDYLATSPLTYVHVFPYSPRVGTEAAGLSDRVPGPIVRERARALREAGAARSRAFRESQVGAVRPGLTLEGGSVVVTDNYLKVRIVSERSGNQLVQVRITNAEPLTGEVTDMVHSRPL
ncbi:MAG: MiaB/RimO family radical SAM methylthiotransferase, partial [Acidobacteriota bacterium]|nr:MiaB/RimO family radical SAM methylthiotransferase [Acidobacteriota bacterium]